MLTNPTNPITCAILKTLHQFKKNKLISALDYYFAVYFYQASRDTLLALMAAAISYETNQGHTCLPILDFIEDSKPSTKTFFQLSEKAHQQLLKYIVIPQNQWIDHLTSLHAIGNGNTITPFVLYQKHLYLHRFFKYETQIVHWVQKQHGKNLDTQILNPIIHRLFPRSDSAQTDWQKIAAIVATLNSFTIISGGPGTGKTTTVTRLMALLIEYAKTTNQAHEMALAAPTGKAASRLTHAIQLASQALACSEQIKALIPHKVTTLHHLLGAHPNQSTYRYHKNNPLPLDTLIIDEASMIDLTLMSHLISALKPQTQLILLGDPHQLTSVEAGSILHDLCFFSNHTYSPQFSEQLKALNDDLIHYEAIAPFNSELNNHFALLRKSYRFKSHSGIGQLAALICQGDTHPLMTLFEKNKFDIRLYPSSSLYTDQFETLVIQGYQPYLKAIENREEPKKIHELFQAYQVLCAIHETRFGIQQINQYIISILHQHQLIHTPTEEWFIGRPIMITQNYPTLSLYNGDLGIVIPDEQGKKRVVFIDSEGNPRFILPSRLPEHETAFSITIHKSQGSEFDQITIILPSFFNPIMTRELIYTAVTRAKIKLHLFSDESIIKKTIEHKTRRYTYLTQRLQSETDQ